LPLPSDPLLKDIYPLYLAKLLHCDVVRRVQGLPELLDSPWYGALERTIPGVVRSQVATYYPQRNRELSTNDIQDEMKFELFDGVADDPWFGADLFPDIFTNIERLLCSRTYRALMELNGPKKFGRHKRVVPPTSPFAPLFLLLQAHEALPPDELLRNEFRELISSKLNPQQSRLIILRYFEACTLNDLAKEFDDAPLSTIHSRCQAALKVLRSHPLLLPYDER